MAKKNMQDVTLEKLYSKVLLKLNKNKNKGKSNMQSKRQFTVLKSASFDTTDVSKTRLCSTEKKDPPKQE